MLNYCRNFNVKGGMSDSPTHYGLVSTSEWSTSFCHTNANFGALSVTFTAFFTCYYVHFWCKGSRYCLFS